MDFTVSVLIPAYNVAAFIEKTIHSVAAQPQVQEIVVVDDGSSDATLKILQEIQKTIPLVQVYQHENGLNKGRSASRNLGIQKATCPYIAFLDADDFYAVDRFSRDQQLFEKNDALEGVYNAVGFEFYRPISEEEESFFKLNTLTQKVAPEDLFEALISCKYGYLHLNGLTLKKAVIEKVGYFNDALIVAEDSDFLFKLALKATLEGGVLDVPVAFRGIHETNVFNNKALYAVYDVKLYESLIRWGLNHKVSLITVDVILKWYWIIRYRTTKGLMQHSFYWIGFLIRNPTVLFSKLSIKYFPIVQKRKQLFSFIFK